MRRSKIIIGTMVATASLALGENAIAKPAKAPARPDRIPPGLEKQLDDLSPGLMRAIIASEGSNSRLQELPVSP